ncbi:uncharacterized protein HGUI_01551 [Hanseniaspora guilliermondii]|uniref:non-specific serine/threonine protein kinase n=1 Tax=Hanseniaspora guilliermondii TaxID=56406 RepID=A0A1L0CX12_9ASCO|nr:uncharacterized protein HGUI_01551 [Hanseniaspora guilliermondii]
MSNSEKRESSTTPTLDPKQRFSYIHTGSSVSYKASSPLNETNQTPKKVPELKNLSIKTSTNLNEPTFPSSADSEFDTDDDIINHYVNTPHKNIPSYPSPAFKFHVTNVGFKKDADNKVSISTQSPKSKTQNDSLSSEDCKSISKSTTLPQFCDEPTLSSTELNVSENFRKEQDEWAERGAAKIVEEVKDKDTGTVVKKIVSRGIKDFKFGQEIGDGSFSRVLLATSIHNPSEKYAIKVLSKSYLVKQNKVKYVNIEKMALQRLNKLDTVVKMFFTFQDQSSLYFVLEYAPYGDFLSIMKEYGTLSEECTKYYSAQIIDAIEDLHKAGIIHRDIKPENILLDANRRIKLTDFGTAKILEKDEKTGSYDLLTRSKSFVGTAEYVSPELLNDSYTDYKCDIWAFGCILFQMIAGKPPFKASNEYLTFQKVQKLQYAFSAGFPTVIRDLVKRILLKQPEKRLEIKDIKTHMFYNDVDFKTIWLMEPPVIQPYKMNAKSMAPIPELANQPLPTESVKRIAKRPSVPIINTSESSTMTSNSSSRSKSTPSTPIKTANTLKKKNSLDPRTQGILDSANRKILERKQKRAAISKPQLKRDESKNAARAAMSATAKKPSRSSFDKRSRNTKTDSNDKLSIWGSKYTQERASKSTAQIKNEFNGYVDLVSIAKLYLLEDEYVLFTGLMDCVLTETSIIQELLSSKRKTLKQLPLFEESSYYRSNSSISKIVSVNKAILAFKIPENSELDPTFWHANDSQPLTTLINEDVTDKNNILSLSHYETKLCCITNLGRLLLFVKTNNSTEYVLNIIIEMNNKNSTLREVTQAKHELQSNYQFVINDNENNSIAFSIPQKDCVTWINYFKKTLFYDSSTLLQNTTNPVENVPRGRMFDTFVNLKESQKQQKKKVAKPESSMRLVSGLPIFDSNHELNERSSSNYSADSQGTGTGNKLSSMKKFWSRKN